MRFLSRRVLFFALSVGLFGSLRARESGPTTEDPYLWLEDIEGAKQLEWVKQQDDVTAKRLTARPEYDALYRDALAVLDSASRIPEVTQRGKYLYNFWRDRDHPRGIYRRATFEEFRKENPKWETVLDVDALAKAEDKPWAFGGAIWLRPDNRRCLIQLAPGGGDASEVREFDAEALKFVEGGFMVPSAKSRIAWLDLNTLYVGTDFGPDTLTKSGYPRIVKVWKRGTPLADAKVLYEGEATSVTSAAHRVRMAEGDVDLVTESLTFWTEKVFQVIDGKLQLLAVPLTARVVDGYRGKLVIWLKENWAVGGTTYTAGSVV
ncbi:MAG TPA: hypothetical protein VKC60_00780, partial [Opitutaceae bacterium]|nr:hypothetical protein [Opitutaceae bacterium]